MKKSLFIVILFVVLHAFPASFFAQGVPGWFLPYDAIFMDMNYASEAIAVGDINGDGLDDVVVTAYLNVSSGIDKIFVFIQNSSTHTFNLPVSYDINFVFPGSEQVLIGDANGDGFNDVVTCAKNGFAVFTHKGSDPLDPLNSAQFYLTTRNDGTTNFTPNNIQLGDFNNDDLNDIVVRNTNDEQILIFYQNSSHTLGDALRFPANGNMSIYCNLSVADFDGDDLADIVYLDDSSTPYNFVVLTQAASGGFNAPYKKSYTFPDSWQSNIHSMEVGDVTGDGLPDIVITQGGNKPNSYLSILANLGGTMADPVAYSSYDCPNAVAIADITGDGRKDIVVQHHGWHRLGLYQQGSDGALAVEELYKYDENTWGINSLACGDINGDGHLDAAQCPEQYGGPGGLHVLFGTSGTVHPTINVLSPNGGEKWLIDSIHAIEWSATSDVEYVKIEFSADNGGSWVTLAENESSTSDYASNSFTWDIPPNFQLSNLCRIRITKVFYDGTVVMPSISDTSLWQFTIYDASTFSLTITSPNGGESWTTGDSREISWTSIGYDDKINIFYSDNSGAHWQTIASGTVNDGSHNWIVPDTPSAMCAVRVQGIGGNPSDTSDALFTITPSAPAIEVTAPSISSQWEKGRTHAITWLKQGAQNANVKIALFKDANTLVQMIANATANDGSYDWLIPANLAVGHNYFIRVRTVDNLLSDISDKFSIIVPKISVTAPTADAVWVRGTTRAITWNKVGTQDVHVKILLYKDGLKKLDIAPSVANSGSFDWAIPATLARGLYTVRIRTLDGKVAGSSKAFTIARN